ncbi:hypothetical protein J7E49_09405 [Variovorax paradoxus]|nr:hypothetical protein [Variovorax paradoxus]
MTARLQPDAGAIVRTAMELVRILQVPAPTMHAFEQRHPRQHRRRALAAAAPLNETSSA